MRMSVQNRRSIGAAGLAACSALLLSQTAVASAWTSDFTITNLYIAGENNFQYRVYGMPANSACSNGPTWGYVNDSDSGSKGQVATLLAAFYSGRPIRLLIEPGGGYCHIVEVFVS